MFHTSNGWTSDGKEIYRYNFNCTFVINFSTSIHCKYLPLVQFLSHAYWNSEWIHLIWQNSKARICVFCTWYMLKNSYLLTEMYSRSSYYQSSKCFFKDNLFIWHAVFSMFSFNRDLYVWQGYQKSCFSLTHFYNRFAFNRSTVCSDSLLISNLFWTK